jgi:hypothetical protein
MLGGSLLAHRTQQSQGDERGLFDITLTVELQQMNARDLSTTVERLASVIGPKLAQAQATFHISVKPTVDKAYQQGLLRFPERDAA